MHTQYVLFTLAAVFGVNSYGYGYSSSRRLSCTRLTPLHQTMTIFTGRKGLAIPVDQSLDGIFTVGSPRVIPPTKDGINLWQMWFHGRDTSFSSDIVKLSTGSIFYATSEDGLSNWIKHPDSPVLLPSSVDGNWWWFDSTHVGLGDVVIPGQESQSVFQVEGGVLMMYFFGGNRDSVSLTNNEVTQSVTGLKMEIGVAVSQDGAHWSRVEGDSPYGAILEAGTENEFDAQFVGWPNVLSISSGVRLYYNTYNPQTKKFIIGAASSTNGIRFTKLGPVFEGGAVGKFDEMGGSRRHVVRLDIGEYRMWYEGVSAAGVHSIGLAKSLDGLKWDRVSDEPVFRPSDDVLAWDAGGVGSPHVVWLPDRRRWRLYYVGTESRSLDSSQASAGALNSAIGIAESIDEDGTSFERLSLL